MKLQRFDTNFLRDFRAPILVNTKAVDAMGDAPPPPAPMFKESDVEHAREAGKKIGYAEGFEAGLAQADTEATGRQRDLTAAMERIEKSIVRLSAQYQELVTEQATGLSELVLLISRKVAGDALATNGASAVQELMGRCLPVIFGKPRIAIELSPTMLAEAEATLRSQLDKSGFTGEVDFRANDSLQGTDVKIEWLNGSATRDTVQIWKEIEGLLATVALSPTVPAIEEKQSIAMNETGVTHG